MFSMFVALFLINSVTILKCRLHKCFSVCEIPLNMSIFLSEMSILNCACV